jgi:hypothetical protein
MDRKYIFTDSDYNSGDGMMTSIWGPTMWHMMHTISFNYPVKPTKEEKEFYYNFYNNLKYILPCRYCRENLVKNLEILPLKKSVFKNRYTLSRYIYDLHEVVNKMLNKKSNLLYEDVRDRYEHFRSRCLQDPKKELKTEKGCTEPLYGIKSKCILNIVPKDNKSKTFTIDKKCVIKKGCNK